MKIAGALTFVAAILLSTLFALMPTSVSILGTDSSCGPPIIRIFVTEVDDSADDEFGFGQGLVDRCVEQSWTRLIIGGIGGSVLAIAGLLMFFLAPKPKMQQMAWGYGPGQGPPYPPHPGYDPRNPPRQ